MPTIHQTITHRIEIPKFLDACSLPELQEIDLLLDKFIKAKIEEERKKEERATIYDQLLNRLLVYYKIEIPSKSQL